MAKEKGYVDILKLSMIPGIAAVVRSKSCSIFNFRLCVLLCAITGFAWQTKVLVEEYLRYPTILNIKDHRIEFTRMPALTFCYLDGFQGRMLRCSGTSCQSFAVREHKASHPGEKLSNHPEYSKVISKRSEIYMLPPEILLKLLNSENPPLVFTYFNYFRLYLEGNGTLYHTPAVGAVCRCKAKAGFRCSPRGLHTRTRWSSLLRWNLDTSLKTTWFHSAAIQFSREWHYSKRRRRWVGVKDSTRNRRHDLKCPSPRRIRMVREDTEGPSEGAT
ncbi:uncharacterized protein TNCV_3573241 [Trichonephila clavipes]|nr:uncharacterized protein TNCV_3573241 [Trichonephila clavipes]